MQFLRTKLGLRSSRPDVTESADPPQLQCKDLNGKGETAVFSAKCGGILLEGWCLGGCRSGVLGAPCRGRGSGRPLQTHPHPRRGWSSQDPSPKDGEEIRCLLPPATSTQAARFGADSAEAERFGSSSVFRFPLTWREVASTRHQDVI